ncbi:hypothetical protein [Paraglaciecola sp.]|uniref:LIC_13387 family protein n=1 Tax=Paraglaciecola sp. TaxID=1920173 RepID=UPI0030F40430
MAQMLLLVGVSIFGILGTVHLIYTFFTDKFSPYDPLVADAMKSTSPRLTKQTTVWRAWIGFNASHSLGAMLLAAVYIPLLVMHFNIVQNSLWFSALPALLGCAYFMLARKYWFKIPFVGISIALMCFIAAALLINL